MKLYSTMLCALVLLLPLSALSAQGSKSGKASKKSIEIKKVAVRETSADTFSFSVTLKSPDSGWDYYADGWRVIDSKTGKIYGTRVLAHPHTTEQPFTRSETIKIPKNVTEVVVVAKMNTDSGYPKKGYKKLLKR